MQQDLRKTGTVGEGSYVPPTLQLEDGNRRQRRETMYICNWGRNGIEMWKLMPQIGLYYTAPYDVL